ncbi:MAG: hypothetical protein IPJ02_10415 [Chitinophagaceae bacterium]|nr:hypothetical protein [Chitinophagaceae bacterium]
MNNSQQFDNYIKEQFSSYAPDVHPRIWENIAARNERRKPVGFWNSNKTRLLLAGLFLAISTGTAWWYFNKTAVPVNTETASGKNSVPGNPQITTGKDQIPGNNNSAAQENPSTGLNTEKGGADPGNTSAGNNSSLSTTGKNNILISAPSSQNDDEISVTENSGTARKKQKGTGSLLNMNMTAPGPEEEKDEYLTGGSLLGRLTFDAEKMAAGQKNKRQLLLSFNQVSFLPDCPGIEKNASGNKKYLEIYAGPDYAFRSLSDTGNSEYLKKRKESTKFSSAYSAGIRYTRVFNNSMSVRAGVNYSQINEKFTFSQGNIVHVTYIIDANGDTLGTYTTTGTRYKTTINKYRSIDVPLVVGYELGNGKWHANINAGVIVNIYSWQKGDVLDASYQPVSITTGKSSSPYQFKTNAGLGFTGGVAVYYKLNEKLHLLAEPYFRYNFSPMNKDNTTLKQKYQTAGLRLGVRLDLK